jgi:outer membrane protein OmpA-like peptidoglycan-associated protein
MHAKVASGILLALGAVELLGLNLLLVPRLPGRSAVSATPVERRDEPPARPEPEPEPEQGGDGPRADTRADVRAASIETFTTEPAKARAAARDIQFSFNGVRIEQRAAFDDLRRVVRELAEDPGRRLVVRGHSDPLGTPAHTLDLSWRRAVAVKQYLAWRGVTPDRVTIEALGDTEPAALAGDGASLRRGPAAWARDRRVELFWR